MNLKEMGWKDENWTHLAQDMDKWRGLLNTVMKLQIP
jgi:hypothetical protein